MLHLKIVYPGLDLVNYFTAILTLIRIVRCSIIINRNIIITVPVVYSVKSLRWKNLSGLKKLSKLLVGDKEFRYICYRQGQTCWREVWLVAEELGENS